MLSAPRRAPGRPRPRRLLTLLVLAPAVLALAAAGLFVYRQSLAGPLARAVGRQDPDAVARLLRRGAPSDVGGAPVLGMALSSLAMAGEMTPAARRTYPARRRAVVGLLLAHGADANAVAFGRPVLFQAIEDGDPALVGALLSHGADPGARDRDGGSALSAAVREDALLHASGAEEAPRLTPVLLAYGAAAGRADPPLVVAVGYADAYTPGVVFHGGDPALVALLLAHGAPVNGRDRAGATALSLAAAQGDPNDVRALLSHGADPRLPDGAGLAPLASAREAEARWLASAREAEARWLASAREAEARWLASAREAEARWLASAREAEARWLASARVDGARASRARGPGPLSEQGQVLIDERRMSDPADVRTRYGAVERLLRRAGAS